MGFYDRNSENGFTPNDAILYTYPWLIVSLGNFSTESNIRSILERARMVSGIEAYNIPDPIYEDLDNLSLISGVDTLSEFDIMRDINTYILEPIRKWHSTMPLGTKVAVVFERKSCNSERVFKLLARTISPFIPICSKSTAEFNLSICTKNECRLPNCLHCKLRTSCYHSCIHRLICMLLNLDEIPQQLLSENG